MVGDRDDDREAAVRSTDYEGRPAEWEPVRGGVARVLESEVRIEMPPDHELAGRELTAVSRCPGCDDALFRLDDGSFAIVHLTWIGRQEQSGWPDFLLFGSFLAVDLAIAQHLH